MNPSTHPGPIVALSIWMAALVPSGPAQAQWTPLDSLTLSGFGTLGVTATSTDDAYYAQPYRADSVDRSGDAGLDSKLALQASLRLSASVTGVLQVITERTAEADVEPSPEWLFLRWDASDRLSVRVGRIGAPFFMNSDARDVNYAQLTARPSFEVYGQVPISHVDGADLVYRFNAGDATVSASVWGGRATARVSDVAEQGVGAVDSRVTLDRLFGLNLSLALDNGLTLRASATGAQVSLDTGRDALDLLATRRKPITFSGVGAMYEHARWQVNAEYTWLRSNTQIADTTGWYVNAGYHWGAFTPFIGVSRIRVDDLNIANPLAADLGQPGSLGDAARLIQAYLNGGNVTQRTLTLGARWDVVDKVAVKLQWDRIFKPAQSYGGFRLKPSGDPSAGQDFYGRRRHVDVMTLNLDFVF
jgi:hypothetical protein